LWLHSLKVAQLLRSAACLHTNQSRSYLNHLVNAINSSKDSSPLKMGPIGFRETSVRNYHYTLRNSPEERNSYCIYKLVTIPNSGIIQVQ